MLVIVSWYSDGSGQPEVRFWDVRFAAELNDAIGLLISDIRATEHKECRVWDVGESVAVLYDSTIPEHLFNKERKQ